MAGKPKGDSDERSPFKRFAELAKRIVTTPKPRTGDDQEQVSQG